MVLDSINDLLWLVLFFPLFLVCSLRLFPVLCSFLVQRPVPDFGRDRTDTDRLRSTQAVSAALAASVGTGNIVGTAQAIAMGGPGAVFWMWIAGILGFAVKSTEIWLGTKDRIGPMSYVRDTLGPFPALFYAAASLCSSLLVGNMTQVNSLLSSFQSLFSGKTGPLRMLLPLALFLAIGATVNGKIRSLGHRCSILVPVMSLLYLGFAANILWRNSSRILPAFRLIIQHAFQPASALAAAAGLSFRDAVIWGLRRGAFSNEAGLGTAALVHSFAEVSSPKRHALWGIVEITLDTLLLCTVSALCILSSGIEIPFGTLPGTELMIAAFSTSYGRFRGALFLSLCLSAFAFSTILGCFLTGLRSASWLGITERRFRFLFLCCSAAACVLPVSLIWHSADFFNILLACPNLIALILLNTRDDPGIMREREEGSFRFKKIKDSALAPDRRKV